MKTMTCPHCHRSNDGHTDVDDLDTESPKDPEPGDLSICLYCGGLGQFDADMALKVPGEETLNTVLSDESVVRAIFARAMLAARSVIQADAE
jgi:hypothetical protein